MKLSEETLAGARKIVRYWTTRRTGDRPAGEFARNLGTDIALIMTLQRAEQDDFAPATPTPVQDRVRTMDNGDGEDLSARLGWLLHNFWADAARWLGLAEAPEGAAYVGEEQGGNVHDSAPT
jgi:hypothetical protein